MKITDEEIREHLEKGMGVPPHKPHEELTAFYAPYKELVKVDIADDGAVSVTVPTVGDVKDSSASDFSLVHYISTPRIDYIHDIMNPFGVNDKALRLNKAVFYNHQWKGSQDLPVGKNLWLKATRDGVLVKTVYAADVTTFARDVYNLALKGFLNSYSIGFHPNEYKIMSLAEWKNLQAQERIDITVGNMNEYNEAEKIIYHKSWNIYEYSQVGVPMNMDAVKKEMLVKALDGGVVLSDLGREVFGSMVGRQKVLVDIAPKHDDEIRWNTSLQKSFDVVEEQLPPDTVLLDWVSKYIEKPIRHIYAGSRSISGARLGQGLSALDSVLADWSIDTIRSLTKEGTEVPPEYDNIKLNSKKAKDFLVKGVRFLSKGDERLVVRVGQTWAGCSMEVYGAYDNESVQKFLDQYDIAFPSFNFLKGEAFSVSGKFFQRTDLTWDNIFLSEENTAALKRVTKQINEKGATAAPRGVILMGAPGNGKTLSGKVMLNEVKDATFIWVSARDFYRMGAFGGLSYGFDIARECAPSILFIEDVDNWLGAQTVDMVKTEMDGLVAMKGVTTILTTNYPEMLPEALIDRPGRFHDVLQFNAPDVMTRRKMFCTWIGKEPIEEKQVSILQDIVKKTEGYSGAYIYELSFLATSEAGEGDVWESLVKSFAKVSAQREQIRQITSPKYTAMTMRKTLGTAYMPQVKYGAVLNKSNKGKLNQVKDLIDEVLASAKEQEEITEETSVEEQRVLMMEKALKERRQEVTLTLDDLLGKNRIELSEEEEEEVTTQEEEQPQPKPVETLVDHVVSLDFSSIVTKLVDREVSRMQGKVE